MRREILLASAAIATVALLAACEDRDKNQTQPGSPSAQTEEGTTPSAKRGSGRSASAEETAMAPQVSDIGFVKTAAMGDLYEIAASRVALERSDSKAVKDFAEEMIEAHMSSSTALKGALPPSAVAMLPSELDAEHQILLRQLREADDAEFDRVYLNQLRDAHEQASGLFTSYAQAGSDARLRQFVQDTLPVIETHAHEVASLSSSSKLAQKSNKSSRD
ncbi:MAG: DUF4142 domain-containing protein [Alphaproteobacteria bacterium]